jgi:hypothetical protein
MNPTVMLNRVPSTALALKYIITTTVSNTVDPIASFTHGATSFKLNLYYKYTFDADDLQRRTPSKYS